MLFSFRDYQENIQQYAPPSSLSPFTKVDRVRYRALEKKHLSENNDISNAFGQLQKRTTKKYFHKVYPIQSRTLSYASSSFPAYRFILPEVITEDWIATVDWHKFQRDHVLHQPLTAYVVLKLLGSLDDSQNNGLVLPTKKRLLDTCVNDILLFNETSYIKEFLLACGLSKESIWLKQGELSRRLWKLLFVETAYLAAVFHDLGYPWQYLGLLGNKLGPITAPAMMREEAVEHSVLKSFQQRLIYLAMNGYNKLDPSTPTIWEKEIRKQTKKAMTSTHGFPGALGFLFLNDCVRQFPDGKANPIRQFCIEWAAVAIMMHDMSKVYHGDGDLPERPHLRLHANVDPLSSLITLADVLQDFERPVGHFSAKPCNCVAVEYEHACQATEISLERNALIINYQMKPHNLAFKRSCLSKEHREYFDRRYGYLNLEAWGIDHVEMQAHKRDDLSSPTFLRDHFHITRLQHISSEKNN